MPRMYIHDESEPAIKSELDMFTVPPTAIAVQHAKWVHIHPRNARSEDSTGPFEFSIERDGNFYDMSSSFLLATLKITHSDGKDLDTTLSEYSAPANYIGATLFRNVRVFMNNSLVYDSGPNYAYRCMMEALLNYPEDTKNTILRAGGYWTQDWDKWNTSTSVGYAHRAALAKGSKNFQVMAGLHADCFSNNRLLPSNLPMRLELYRNPNEFSVDCLMDPPNEKHKLKVIDLVWVVKQVKLIDSIAASIEATLERHVAKYPVRRTECKDFNLPQGVNSVNHLQVVQGQIPRRIVLGMVEPEAFSGAYGKFAFHFGHFDVSQLQLDVSGVSVPSEPLQVDFGKQNCVEAYMSMFQNLNMNHETNSNGIEYDEFLKGTTLFVFDLLGDPSEAWRLINDGTVSVSMQFAKTIPDIKLLVYCEYDNLLTINKHREVMYDFSA